MRRESAPGMAQGNCDTPDEIDTQSGWARRGLDSAPWVGHSWARRWPCQARDGAQDASGMAQGIRATPAALAGTQPWPVG